MCCKPRICPSAIVADRVPPPEKAMPSAVPLRSMSVSGKHGTFGVTQALAGWFTGQ
jgi:hypothetical protein